MEQARVLSTDTIGFSGHYYVQLVTEKLLCNVPHRHEFYELVCVLSSSCVQNVNGHTKPCPAQSITILSPADTHFFEQQEKGVSLLSLSVTKEEMELFLTAYSLKDLTDSEEYRLSHKDISRLKSLYAQAVMCPNSQPILKSMLAIILTRVLEQSATRSFCAPDPAIQIAEKMNELENLREGLPALLRISGYSYSQLWRLMKQWFHMTPKEYINRLRMEYAYTMVLTGNRRVEDIASAVGFSSFSHFNELMKQHYGHTSSELRNTLNRESLQ